MTQEEKETLVKYRLERANESIKAAQLLFENKLFIPAMNRIYYSMFYSVQALLVLDEKAFSKHGQVKAYFNREFIKTGVFPKEFGKLFNAVFEYRQKFDYVDLLEPEEELIWDYIAEARKFIAQISSYLNDKLAGE
ncbi:MAG: HEPN domain-containing protein [Sedimentisphaerales bacterium]|nr:HEPN domain-containing protein [Sedimentisphaerales bacterium]